MTSREEPFFGGDEPLKELYLIVRPEEKYDLERTLQTIMAPIYTTMNGLGRGTRRELRFSPTAGRGPLRWLRGPELALMLPKTIFHMVIPESRVDAVIEAAGGVVRMKGGPGDCGLGVAIIGEVVSDIAIGEPVRPETRVHRAAEPENWHHEGPP